MTHATRIAHALQKLKVSIRLLKEAEKEVRQAFEDARKPTTKICRELGTRTSGTVAVPHPPIESHS